MGAIGSRYPTRRGRRGRPAGTAGPSGNVGEAGGDARLPGRCVEAGQLAMRLHDAAGRGRPSPVAAIARPGRTRRRRPVRPATGRCGTAHRHAPSRHPADGCGSGNPQKTSCRIVSRCARWSAACDSARSKLCANEKARRPEIRTLRRSGSGWRRRACLSADAPLCALRMDCDAIGISILARMRLVDAVLHEADTPWGAGRRDIDANPSSDTRHRAQTRRGARRLRERRGPGGDGRPGAGVAGRCGSSSSSRRPRHARSPAVSAAATGSSPATAM